MAKSSSLIFGLHAVLAQLKTNPARIQKLMVLKARHDQKIQGIIKQAELSTIPVQFMSREELDRCVDGENHQGVVALCHPIQHYSEDDLEKILTTTTHPFLLVLDGIQDPHNLGACLRTAEAAGVHAVIAPRDKAASLTPAAIKVASGAADVVPFIQVTNLARTLRFLKEQGIWIFGAAEDADKKLFETDLKGPVAIVLGGEGDGLRRLTREHCDVLVNIPMAGSVSSLNVSVAAGVFLFETVRQRGL